MPGLPENVTTAALADLLSLTPRRVQQLVDEGVLVKVAHGKLALKSSVQGYLGWKLQSETRPPTKSEDALDRERIRKLKLENDETERRLVGIDDAVAAVDAIAGPIPSELAGVAPRVSDDLAIRRKVEDEINAVCTEISKRLHKAGVDLREGRDALAAGAADDPDGVGEEE